VSQDEKAGASRAKKKKKKKTKCGSCVVGTNRESARMIQDRKSPECNQGKKKQNTMQYRAKL
jgi:hypothetical protein